MENIFKEIQKHLEAAYALLPPKIDSDERGRQNLAQKYESKDWYQLFAFLRSYSRVNYFSEELLLHLGEAEKLYEEYDRLGMRRALNELTKEEKHIIGECLHAAAHGPFFLDDWEFSIVFGATHEEAVQVAAAWPKVEETDMTARTVINNSINNLFGYPHRKHDQWPKYISVSPQRVDEIFYKFRVLTGMADTREKTRDSQYFQNMM